MKYPSIKMLTLKKTRFSGEMIHCNHARALLTIIRACDVTNVVRNRISLICPPPFPISNNRIKKV